MASTYIDQQQKDKVSTDLAASTASTVPTGSTPSASDMVDAAKSTASGNSYLSRMQSLSAQTYQPGEGVQSAQNYLQQVISNKPGSYEGKYTNQLQDIYNQIMNRQKFSYDMNGDALYGIYKQMYQQQGKQAMRDTVGQAAAQTGGYSNSYAATAGNAAYQNYLQQLNEAGLGLQQQALERYNQQGNDLMQRYDMVQSADQFDYNRYANELQNWQNERSYAQQALETAQSQDYTDYQNRMSQAETILGIEREDAQIEKSQAYDWAMQQIAAGVTPNATVLAAAGISDADAAAMVKRYKKLR